MTIIFFHTFYIEKAIFVLIITGILLCHGCLNHPETAPLEPEKHAPSIISSDTCIDVKGTVLGDIIPYSNVSLYETSSLNFSFIMSEIRTTQPVRSGTVNESDSFIFSCLSPGKYVLVIPSSCYNTSVGSPLPYEFDCENFSLRIAFQGGDFQYAVGAFSIYDSTIENTSTCRGIPLVCQAQKRGLYRECPLHQGEG